MYPVSKRLAPGSTPNPLLTLASPGNARASDADYGGDGDADDWEVDRAEISMNNKLGMGQYGDVYEAVWRPSARRNGAESGCVTTVAVKTLKEDAMALPDFLAEAELMKQLHHPSTGFLKLFGKIRKFGIF